MGYDEIDRVSVTRCLGCQTDNALSDAVRWQQPLTLKLAKTLEEALSRAATYQQPLSPELAKALVDAGAFGKDALSCAALYQSFLPFKLAKLLVDAGCDPAAQDGSSRDSLVHLAHGSHPVDPQVTGLFLPASCRTNLGGCKRTNDRTRLRFDQVLKEHAE